MGEKGNGGHVETGGRAVRTAGDPGSMGMGGTPMTGAAQSATEGGGGLGDAIGNVGDHATDIGGAAFGRHREDDDES
jgi:hypothetical protein